MTGSTSDPGPLAGIRVLTLEQFGAGPSGTVFLATLSLFIFGGGPINDFAFTFLVGILTGTYSSIYIASALVLWWHKGQRPKIGAAQMSGQTTTAPARP